MLSLSEGARNVVERVLIEFGEEAQFVIYPFGEGGKILKGILNYEYDIHEVAIIDNFLASKSKYIKDLSWLKDHQDVIVLISSNRPDQFDEIRAPLYELIGKNRCIEAYESNILEGDYYKDLLRLTKIYEINTGLVRVGNKNDGGYVMANDMPGGVAYSFGISDDPSWDMDMCKRGYEVFMYDHTVDCPLKVGSGIEHMHFSKRGIADKVQTDKLCTLRYFINENGHENEDNLILKMDVEGAEWGFLEMVASEELAKFRQIVMELHGMNSIDERDRIIRISGLSKLFETHRAVHLHANNFGTSLTFGNRIFPNTWEITYVRKGIGRGYM